MANERYRLMFKFWLDIAKPDEESVADIIEKLKSARRYSAAVRDGLRLIWDLSQGKTDVLLELFPFVKATLSGNDSGGDDGGGVSKSDIERLERLIKESQHGLLMKDNGSVGLQPLGGIKSLGGIKPLAAGSIAPPSFDDGDDFTLAVSKADSSGSNAGANLIRSLMALQNPKSN